MNEIGMGKDEIRTNLGKDGFGWDRTGLTKNGKKWPWCNGPLTSLSCQTLRSLATGRTQGTFTYVITFNVFK